MSETMKAGVFKVPMCRMMSAKPEADYEHERMPQAKGNPPIRPHCCTKAIPWLGTCRCGKLNKSCRAYCLHKKTIQKITMRTWRLWVRKYSLHTHLKEAIPVRQFLAYTQQNVPKYSVPEPAAHIKTQSEQGCLRVPSSLCAELCEGTNMQAFKR